MHLKILLETPEYGFMVLDLREKKKEEDHIDLLL